MGDELVLPHNWMPRDYQFPLWQALTAGYKRVSAVCHRRWGKDLFFLNWSIREAMRVPGVYWHVLPEYKQARKVVWDGVTTQGRRFMDHFPPEIVIRQREDEMTTWLVNGSVHYLVGGDNYNSLVGTNPRGIVFSEYSIMDPACWRFMQPVLAENGGWAGFIFTPRGRNHGHKLHTKALKNPKWYATLQTVDDTHAISKEALEDIRLEEGMSEDLIQQEFFCSWDAALEGAYWGKQVADARKQARIGKVPWEPLKPVTTAWDLGFGDSTAIWFCQQVGAEVRLIDFYRASNVGLEHYTKVLSEKPYTYSDDLLPHDAKATSLQTGKTTFEMLRSMGRRPRLVPKIPLAEGINAVRALFPRMWFDEAKCEEHNGIQALQEYTKTWDGVNKVYSDTPLHNWASHPADALRTLAVGLRPEMKKRPTLYPNVAIV